MSEKEEKMFKNITMLPQELQDKFYDRLDGAIMALDAMETAKKQHQTEHPAERGE